MSCHVFAGRFRSRQRRTVGKKSENGRCKLTKNRNTEPLIIRQDVKKGTKLNEYPLQDKRRSKEHNFGIIPLISSSKSCFMDTDGLKIVLNIV